MSRIAWFAVVLALLLLVGAVWAVTAVAAPSFSESGCLVTLNSSGAPIDYKLMTDTDEAYGTLPEMSSTQFDLEHGTRWDLYVRNANHGGDYQHLASGVADCAGTTTTAGATTTTTTTETTIPELETTTTEVVAVTTTEPRGDEPQVSTTVVITDTTLPEQETPITVVQPTTTVWLPQTTTVVVECVGKTAEVHPDCID